jgi:phenylpyruvate tautomerase PptA (4-oxalocrotonate tautomerase family)
MIRCSKHYRAGSAARIRALIVRKETPMPLVRISFTTSNREGYGPKIGEVVYRAMVDTINVPAKDNFQIITEHDKTSLIYDPDYLGIHRTDGMVVIQVILNEGRTVEAKKAFYKTVADRLHAELGVRTEDVLINLVEVKKENWSFGNGVAQYAP